MENSLYEIGKECTSLVREAILNIESNEGDSGFNVKTEADDKSQNVIISFLKDEKFPALVYSEETEEPVAITKNPDYTFVLDPIDGSYFLMKGLEEFCSVAILVLKDEEPVAAFVRGLATGDLYWCDEEKAYKNDEELKINGEITSRPLVTFWSPHGDRFREILPKLSPLAEDCSIHNFAGQLLLAKIAEGAVDANIETTYSLHELTGALIAKRAGAVLTTMEGEDIVWDPEVEQSWIVSANQELHDRILECFD